MTNNINTGWSWKKDTDKWEKEQHEREKHKYYCTCGHSVILPYNRDETICSWCKHKIRKKDADEKRYFRDKMRQLLNKKEN